MEGKTRCTACCDLSILNPSSSILAQNIAAEGIACSLRGDRAAVLAERAIGEFPERTTQCLRSLKPIAW